MNHLDFMQDNDFRDAVTADVQRHLGWAGWKLGDSQALIWGSNLRPGLKQRIRSEIIDWVWNRFQANAFAITEENWAVFTKKVLQAKATYPIRLCVRCINALLSMSGRDRTGRSHSMASLHLRRNWCCPFVSLLRKPSGARYSIAMALLNWEVWPVSARRIMGYISASKIITLKSCRMDTSPGQVKQEIWL